MRADTDSEPLAPSAELIRKIRDLPAERIAELEDFVDFLRTRAADRALSITIARLSEDALRRVWDNPDDADYDRL